MAECVGVQVDVVGEQSEHDLSVEVHAAECGDNHSDAEQQPQQDDGPVPGHREVSAASLRRLVRCHGEGCRDHDTTEQATPTEHHSRGVRNQLAEASSACP